MYTHFYHLKSKPFTLLPDPKYLFLTHKHNTALVYLEYGIVDQAGFIVVTGEVGIGKTTLIKYLLNKLDDSIRVAYISNTNITPQEFLRFFTKELEIPSLNGDKTEVLDAINQFLVDEYASGHRVVLIIDEAQNLSVSTLEEIRMLSNLQTEEDHLLQIVLVGQPSLRDKLRHPCLKQFSQRVTVNYHLIPLDLQETKAYIHHRLEVSQAQDVNLFAENAINTIYHSSGGIPRVINILCDASLVYGFAEGLTRIDQRIVDQVISDKRDSGIFCLDDDLKTTEFPDFSNSATDGLQHRVSMLEQELSDLRQKVLPALYNFSQIIGDRAHGPEAVNNPAIDKLEQMLTWERRAKEHLILECDRLKRQLEQYTERDVELEEEIAGLKQSLEDSTAVTSHTEDSKGTRRNMIRGFVNRVRASYSVCRKKKHLRVRLALAMILVFLSTGFTYGIYKNGDTKGMVPSQLLTWIHGESGGKRVETSTGMLESSPEPVPMNAAKEERKPEEDHDGPAPAMKGKEYTTPDIMVGIKDVDPPLEGENAKDIALLKRGLVKNKKWRDTVDITTREIPVVDEVEFNNSRALKQAGTITDIESEMEGDILKVILTSNGIIPRCKAFLLDEPTRLVIDLFDTANAFSEKLININSPYVHRIRIGTYPDKVRLCLDSPRKELPPHRIVRNDSGLVIVMGGVERTN